MPPPAAICRLGLEDAREKIRAHPLFASLDSFEVVEFEIELFWDPSRIPAGHPRRPSYFRCESIPPGRDRKSTRLNSSHSQISYAVFCLKKKKKKVIIYD